MWLTVYSCIHVTLAGYWENEKERAKRGQKARIWLALFRCLKWSILFHGIFIGLEVSTV